MIEVEKNPESADNLQIYEVGFMLEPNLSESSVQEIFSGIKNAIAERKGTVISEEFPKRRELAYEMVKSVLGSNRRYVGGFFGWVKFELETSLLNDLKVIFEQKVEIIRFLLIKTVRENTLIYQRVPFVPRVDGEKPRREAPKVQDGVVPTPISEEELNKSIEKLIVE